MNEQPSKVSAPYGKSYFQKLKKNLIGVGEHPSPTHRPHPSPPPSAPSPPRLHVRSSPAVNLTTRVA